MEFTLDILRRHFKDAFNEGGKPDVFFAPGRVNLIGEHLDYNGGVVFPAAISLGIYGVVRYRDDGIISLKSLDTPGTVSFETGRNLAYSEDDTWGNYPKGVIKYMMEEGVEIRGADILFCSTLPQGSGLSSSAAIEICTAGIFEPSIIASTEKKIHAAHLCRRVENKFIGVQSGIMDQFAVALGKKDHAVLLDTSDTSFQHVPFDTGTYTLVIMNTNKPRKLSESKFNERQSECQKALKIIQKHKDISYLAAATEDDIHYIDDTVLQKRARHIITENKRVYESEKALRNDDLKAFGTLMNGSHCSLRDDYEVTGKELDTIVDSAWNFPGCIGARMTGAGFGGCAIAMVESSRYDSFCSEIKKTYTGKTDFTPSFFRCDISEGISKI